jgi:hypothetical protein
MGNVAAGGLLDDSQTDGSDTDFDYSDLRNCVVLWAVCVPGDTTVWYRAQSSGDSLD